MNTSPLPVTPDITDEMVEDVRRKMHATADQVRLIEDALRYGYPLIQKQVEERVAGIIRGVTRDFCEVRGKLEADRDALSARLERATEALKLIQQARGADRKSLCPICDWYRSTSSGPHTDWCPVGIARAFLALGGDPTPATDHTSCSECDGKGRIFVDILRETVRCDACEGSGRAREAAPTPDADFFYRLHQTLRANPKWNEAVKRLFADPTPQEPSDSREGSAECEHAGLVAEICERLDCDDESILIALDQLDEARQDAQRTNGELHKQWQAKYDTLAAHAEQEGRDDV